jgi:glutamate dehydrogenase/leucine dehydrogenase
MADIGFSEKELQAILAGKSASCMCKAMLVTMDHDLVIPAAQTRSAIQSSNRPKVRCHVICACAKGFKMPNVDSASSRSRQA